MKKVKVDFYLKSGNNFSMWFKEFIVKHNKQGGFESFEWVEIGNKILVIDIKQVEVVVIN